jgi:riboflavin biosynthesis pyrimidine reductase
LTSQPVRKLFQEDRRPRILCLNIVLGSERAHSLRQQGVQLIGFNPVPGTTRIPLQSVLAYLHSEGISSVLIEPGLRFIPALLQTPHLLDALVVTTAPLIIGSGGQAPSYDKVGKQHLKTVNTMRIGQDTVMASHFIH